jgi:hypothetical protein
MLEQVLIKIDELQGDIKDLRKDFHGLIWKVVGISSATGTIGAVLMLILGLK